MAPILALGHQSRVGKDAAARAIVKAIPGAQRFAFAGYLKALCAQIFGRYGMRGEDYYDAYPQQRTVPLEGIGKTPVQVWIEFGQAMRGIHAPFWVEHVARQLHLNPCPLVVVSDLRFENEARVVRDLGGWCVRIDRPGNPVLGSDRQIGEDFGWDDVITNDGTLEDLERKAVWVARRILRGDG